ncbi:von Willebrand factor type A domain protein [uncultured archaeon]|nr:von Willebrand factor type A domain protein [uncultured archaeon]
MYFNFTYPEYLYLLFSIPFLIFFYFYNIKNVGGRSVKFANYEAIARVKGIDLYSKNINVLILDIIIVVALIFSLSGLTLYKEMTVSSFSFVIAVDSSESMGATDILPSRISAAKDTATNFINLLPEGSRAGVISFSGNSYVEQEVTDNKQIIKTALNKIELTTTGGTDLYEALSTSSFLLKNEDNKAVILLSDGQINIGNLDEVIQDALKKGITIHTIAMGTVEGGSTGFGISKVDEDTLKSLAYSTGGKFFAVNSKEKMGQSFNEIIPLTTKLGAVNLSFILIIATLVLFILRQFLISVIRISI